MLRSRCKGNLLNRDAAKASFKLLVFLAFKIVKNLYSRELFTTFLLEKSSGNKRN